MGNNSSKTLAIHGSGPKRPRYFDRQQLRAADLTLEQQYLSHRSRQLNRHLHGWGVTSGALVNQTETGVSLTEGFAVTPLGDALYIPAIADIDLAALVENSCCGSRGVDCEDIRPAEEGDEAAPATRRVYLIARPALLPSDPRTGVPEDCGHLGNHLAYSRECDAVSLAVVCELTPPHLVEELQCDLWRELFCPDSRTTDYAQLLNELLPMPPAVDEDANYVVLAALDLIFVSEDLKTVARLEAVSYAERRLLLPTQLLQRYLSCLCSMPAPTPSPSPSVTPTPTVTRTPRPSVRPTATVTYTLVPTFTPTMTATLMPTWMPTQLTRAPITRFPLDDYLDLDIRVYDVALGKETSIDSLSELEAPIRRRLHAMGINSIAELYAADTTVVAEELQISEVQVAEFKENALNGMKRAEPITLDESRFDIDKGSTLKTEEVHNIGAARAVVLRENGYGSVLDVANANAGKLAGLLSLSENQARAMINDAQVRIRR